MTGRSASADSPCEFEVKYALASMVFVLLAVGVASAQVRAEETDDAERVRRLSEALSSGDLAKRRDAAYELHVLGPRAKDAVPALTKALRDRDQHLWYYAATALARIGPDAVEATPALLDALRDGRGQRWYRAAYALGQVGKAIVPELRAAVTEESDRLRRGAAKALGWIGPDAEAAIPELEDLLTAGEDDIDRIAAGSALARIGRAAVPALSKALSHEAAATRRFAATALGLSEADIGVAVRPLLERVDDEDPAVRVAALSAYVRAAESATDEGDGVTEILPVLIRKLSDDDEEVRARSQQLLGRLPSESTLPSLLRVVEGNDAKAVRGAAGALRRAGVPAEDAIDRLLSALVRVDGLATDPDFVAGIESFGAAAIEACLSALATPNLSEARRDTLCDLLGAVGQSAEERLLVALTHDNPVVRGGAATALGRSAEPGAKVFDNLRLRFADDDAYVRAQAVRAWGELGDRAPAALDELAHLLEDSTARVRAAAVFALGRSSVGPRERVALVAEALEDKDPDVRARAAGALVDAGEAAVVVLAKLEVALEDPHRDVKLHAARALGGLGERAQAAAPALCALLDGNDEDLARTAAEAVGRLGEAGGPCTESLARLLGPDFEEPLQLAAAAALRRVGPNARAAIPALEKALRDGTAKVRAGALNALARVVEDETATLKRLTDLLGDRESGVRLASMELLGAFGEKAQAAVPRLFDRLDDRYDRAAAFGALEKIRPSSVPTLVNALFHRERFVRGYACNRLRELGAAAKDAIPTLEILVKDEREERVRDAAKRALRDIKKSL